MVSQDPGSESLLGVKAHKDALLVPEGVRSRCQRIGLAEMVARSEVTGRLESLERDAVHAQLLRHLAGADPRACWVCHLKWPCN